MLKSIVLLFVVVLSVPSLGRADQSEMPECAKENRREARKPLIDTDQGGLLLFVFLLAGTIGGFAAGYSWRILVSEK